MTESELISRAKSGDEIAFDALVGPLIEPAWRFAVTILRDSEEARDAVQEAAFKAWRKLGQLRDGTPLRPWFFTIVANQCRSIRRTRWWRVVRLANSPGTTADVEDATLSVTDLRRGLNRLGKEDRMVLYLFFFQDLPQDEVAQIMGLSTGAVKARVHRAVRRLRPELEVEELPV